MALSTILIIVLILVLIGALPTWPIQSRLGILSGWRTRIGPLNRAHPRVDGAPLTTPQCVNQLGPMEADSTPSGRR
jgi:hypothetical protein